MKNEKENDLVRVEVNGKNKVLSIEIKADSFEDKDLIQDMIVIAINKANEKASKENNVAKLRELFDKRLKLEGNKRCQN